jgi:hypothetical protein
MMNDPGGSRCSIIQREMVQGHGHRLEAVRIHATGNLRSELAACNRKPGRKAAPSTIQPYYKLVAIERINAAPAVESHHGVTQVQQERSLGGSTAKAQSAQDFRPIAKYP